MTIRDPAPADHEPVRALLVAAFDGPAEADLVEQLRSDGDAQIELVAEQDGEIVGHILFSVMQAPLRAIALAPVAVQPEQQGRGIGSSLVEAGHGRARAAGWEAVFLLGDPAYYSRFGYSVEAAAAFDCAYSGPHFMALPLVDPLPVAEGTLRYAPAFDALG